MSIFSSIDEIISEHGSAKILRERLTLLKDQLELLVNENVKLKEELAEVKARNTELNEKISSYTATEEFVEYGMAIFKRKGKGVYSELVYCPKCKHPMSPAMFGVYRCSDCKHNSEIKNGTAQSVIADLIRRDDVAARP